MKWINTRVGQYLIYGLMYFTFWKLGGFEFTVILLLSTILGEIMYQDLNKNGK